MRSILLGSCIAVFAFFSLLPAGKTEDFTGTLKKINDTGEIRLGIQEETIPFSYYGMGYSYEYSLRIIDAIKQRLGKPNLKVTHVPITNSDRIPLLQENAYDFECSSTTNNLNRQQQVGFSNTIFIAGTRLLVHKNSGIKDFADIKGKKVAVGATTTAESILVLMNQNEKMNISIQRGKGNVEAFALLESGEAVAYFADDAILAGDRTKAINPREWVLVGTPQSFEAYGCMMQKDDPQFKSLLDKTIADIQISGDGNAIHEKWFLDPIPPKGMSMNFELSDTMIKLFAAPNDRAL